MSAIRFSAQAEDREVLTSKLAALESILRSMGRTLVAYSGGVDSTLLLVEARRVLGSDAMGIIGRSPSLPAAELAAALATTRERDIPVRVLDTREMEREGYRSNGSDRCYHCKSELFERMAEVARDEGWRSLAYGAVTDDLGDDRPGMRAAEAIRVRAPLLEAGLGKLEVRILARAAGLRVWDKPQSACLASRLPHGTEVTRERLSQVERGEGWLRSALGLRVVRLRHEGDRARIEVPPGDIPRISTPQIFSYIQKQLRNFGFGEVSIDPAGYRRPDPQPT